MPQMTIKPAFELGKIVYLVSDPDQYERIVVGYFVQCNGMAYLVRYADEDFTIHTLVELSHIKSDVEKRLEDETKEDEEED
jgi:hypothetical protein